MRPVMSARKHAKQRQSRLDAWRRLSLVLCVAGASSSLGCAETPDRGKIPDPPVWFVDQVDEYEAMVEAGDYPAVQDWIATAVHYHEAIRCWNDPKQCEKDESSCWPRTWSGWASLLFSLECPH